MTLLVPRLFLRWIQKRRPTANKSIMFECKLFWFHAIAWRNLSTSLILYSPGMHVLQNHRTTPTSYRCRRISARRWNGSCWPEIRCISIRHDSFVGAMLSSKKLMQNSILRSRWKNSYCSCQSRILFRHKSTKGEFRRKLAIARHNFVGGSVLLLERYVFSAK